MKLDLSVCDLCGKQNPSSQVSSKHYSGKFWVDGEKGIVAEIKLHFMVTGRVMHEYYEEDKELCYKCRKKIAKSIQNKTYELV